MFPNLRKIEKLRLGLALKVNAWSILHEANIHNCKWAYGKQKFKRKATSVGASTHLINRFNWKHFFLKALGYTRTKIGWKIESQNWTWRAKMNCSGQPLDRLSSLVASFSPLLVLPEVTTNGRHICKKNQQRDIYDVLYICINFLLIFHCSTTDKMLFSFGIIMILKLW